MTHVYYDKVFSGYTLLGCGATAGTDSVFYTPRSTFDDLTKSSRTISLPTTAPIRPTTTVTDGASTSTAAPAPPASGGSSTNVGAIAGGVVGGLAGIVMIIGAIMFFVRRKAAGKDAGPNATDVSPAAATGFNGGNDKLAPNTPGGYNGIPTASAAPLVPGAGGYDGGFYDNMRQQTPSPMAPYGAGAAAAAYGMASPQQQHPHNSYYNPASPQQQMGQYPGSPTSAYDQQQQQQYQAYHPSGVSNTASGAGGFLGAPIPPNHTGERSSTASSEPLLQPSPQRPVTVAHEMSSEPGRHFTAELDGTHAAKEMAA